VSTNTLGKYQIIREIARSNDIIYEALDPTLNRRVALKELAMPPNLSPNEREERRKRFRREAAAAGKLSHPNIVSVFDYGSDRDRCYIAMEYLEGQTLRDVLKLRGALSVDEASRIMIELLDALAYAHERGVVHRDIKPDNVQILPGGHIKLTDFGIARLMDEPSITADGQIFGTPSYMSPEQVAGKQVDHRSDLFSCGVLLYEMLTGRKPFAGDSVVTITYNIMNMEPPPAPGVPGFLSAIIRKAMAKDPNRRYQNAAEMAEDLRNQRAPNGFEDQYAAQAGGYQIGAGGAPSPQPYAPPTSYPTAGAGTASGAPDPFQRLPLSVPPVPPAPPREPVLSPEARNFLGVFFVVLGLTGMLLFAIWAINEAYQTYSSNLSRERAAAYYNQGQKLFERGDYKGALEQFGNAVRLSPRSKIGQAAMEGMVASYLTLGKKELDSGRAHAAISLADQALSVRKDSAAAHLLKAQALTRLGQMNRALDELKAAAKSDPAAEEAKTAREEIAGYYIAQADQLARSGRQQEAVELYRQIIQDYVGTNAAAAAYQRLNENPP